MRIDLSALLWEAVFDIVLAAAEEAIAVPTSLLWILQWQTLL